MDKVMVGDQPHQIRVLALDAVNLAAGPSMKPCSRSYAQTFCPGPRSIQGSAASSTSSVSKAG